MCCWPSPSFSLSTEMVILSAFCWFSLKLMWHWVLSDQERLPAKGWGTKFSEWEILKGLFREYRKTNHSFYCYGREVSNGQIRLASPLLSFPAMNVDVMFELWQPPCDNEQLLYVEGYTKSSWQPYEVEAVICSILQIRNPGLWEWKSTQVLK